MNPLVVGLGQCSLDILGQVDCYPNLDEKAELSSLLIQGGGPVATAMVTLARLGVPVSMVGSIGDDDFGNQIRDGLSLEKVDCSHLQQLPDCTSQVAFISVDKDGHRNIFWHRGTAFPDVPDRLSDLLAGSVKVLHLDGLHLESALKAAKMARSMNVKTVLDAGTLRPGLKALLPLMDYLVVSERFARQFVGGDDHEAAIVKLAGFGATSVTVTLGKFGSLSKDIDGSFFHQSAFDVDVVDTTGCGDVFHGGYIYGLLKGWNIKRIVRFSTACAALKTRALGGRTAIPNLSEVENFLRSQNESR